VGLSFRQTVAVIAHYCNRSKIAKLSGLNDRMVGQFVRIIVGVSLQTILKVLSSPSVWAFLLAGDISNHFGVSLFGERIRGWRAV
jgi:predicted Zn-dependent protease